MPIVYGSSKIRDVLPANNSAILVTDFPEGAKELADYLHQLNENDEEYETYLEYKNGVTNPVLLKLMNERDWSSIFDHKRESFIDSYQCFICNRLHTDAMLRKAGKKPKTRQANKDHYGCPIPYTFNEEGQLIDEKFLKTEKWIDSSFKFSFEIANCEQKVFFDHFLKSNIHNFTAKELRAMAHNFYHRFKRNASNTDQSLRFDL